MSTDAAAARRLREAVTLLDSGAIPECPVCLEEPLRSDARILRCCTGILCRSCIPQCLGTCPLCRQPFQAVESHTDRSAASGESPYTYTFQEYTFQEYTHLDYGIDTAAGEGSSHSGFTATNDYNRSSESYSYSYSEPVAGQSTAPAKSYEYSFSEFSATNAYSSSTDYSAPDYSDISQRYGVR